MWIWFINFKPYELPINLWIQLGFFLIPDFTGTAPNLSRSVIKACDLSIWMLLAHSVIIVYSLECVQDKLLCTQSISIIICFFFLNETPPAHIGSLLLLFFLFGIRGSSLRNCNRECIFWFGFESKPTGISIGAWIFQQSATLFDGQIKGFRYECESEYLNRV